MSSREPMSPVDTAWLRMDRPENLMQIVGVMLFKGRIDSERFKRTVALRLLRYKRFRQIAVLDEEGAWWTDDPDFSIDRHVPHTLLPSPGGRQELQRFVAEMASTPLNPARPRWEFNLVETGDGNSALVARIHHAIADGIALIGVFNSLTDAQIDAAEDGGVAPLPMDTPDAVPEVTGEAGDSLWRMILEPVSGAVLRSIRVGGHLWGQYLGLRQHPETLRHYTRVAAAVAKEIGTLARLPDDSKTRLKGKASSVKRVAWSEPISLAEIKAVGRVLGCSINDTLLAAVAGALRAYLVAQGDPVDGVEIRAMVPVNLRTPEDNEALGNRFGLVALDLPIGIENPLARLYATRARMAALKNSHQAMLTFALLAAAGMAPKFVQDQLLRQLAGKTTAVMTNVPGPRQPRFFAGSRIRQQFVWVPQAGDIGVGVSILSYQGWVQFGLITDHSRVNDPEQIVSRFAGEFDKLLWLVLLEPWDRLSFPAVVEEDLVTLVSSLAAAKPSRQRSRHASSPPARN